MTRSRLVWTLFLSKLVHKEWVARPFFRHYLHQVLSRMSWKRPVMPEAGFVFRPWSIKPSKVRVVFVFSGCPYMNNKFNHGHALSAPMAGKSPGYPRSWCVLMKEYCDNLGFTRPTTSSLQAWVDKGIMLIYHIPITDGVRPDRYEEIGWEMLAYDTIAHLSDNREGIVFVFLGRTCWYLSARVDQTKHLVLRTPYPATTDGFAGCGIFTTILNYIGEDRYFFKLPTSKVKR